MASKLQRRQDVQSRAAARSPRPADGFLLHVVPDGFVRIRHFGLLANRRRAAHLAQCRALLAAPPVPPPAPPESVRALMLRVTGLDIERCPVCQQGQFRPVERLAPAPLAWDTS